MGIRDEDALLWFLIIDDATIMLSIKELKPFIPAFVRFGVMKSYPAEICHVDVEYAVSVVSEVSQR